MIKYFIGLLCEDDWGREVVQVYENNGANVGQFPKGSPKIPENCLMFSDECSFWLEMARNATNNEAKYACFRYAEKAKLLEIQKRR